MTITLRSKHFANAFTRSDKGWEKTSYPHNIYVQGDKCPIALAATEFFGKKIRESVDFFAEEEATGKITNHEKYGPDDFIKDLDLVDMDKPEKVIREIKLIDNVVH